MSNWYCKSLGYGDSVFKELKRLRVMRYEACLIDQNPYRLAVNVETAETMVYFEPKFWSLATTFGAQPCRAPVLDGVRLLDLDFKPVHVPLEFLSTVVNSVHGNHATSL